MPMHVRNGKFIATNPELPLDVTMRRLGPEEPEDHLFDPKTYTSPATIPSMVRLREFIFDYFTQYVLNDHDDTASVLLPGKERVNDAQDPTVEPPKLRSFVGLVTHSPGIFARARAVLPTLSATTTSSSQPDNPALQIILDATASLRDQKYDELPEEIVWEKFLEGKKRGVDKLLQGFFPSDLAAMSLQGSEHNSPSRQPTELSPIPSRWALTIPEFVPSSSAAEMVWDPKTGSRPRRPSDDFETPGGQVSSFKDSVAGIHPTSATYDTGLRSAVRTPVPYHDLQLPPTESPHRSRSNPTFLADVTNTQDGPHFPTNPRHFAERAHYHPVAHRKRESASSDPCFSSPSKKASEDRSTPSEYHEPQHSHSNTPTLRDLSSHGGRATSTSLPLHVIGDPDSYPHPEDVVTAPANFVPGPMTAQQIRELGIPESSRQLVGQVYPQRNPPSYEATNIASIPPTLMADDGSMLTVPLQGQMDPLTYWNYLYQRESLIRGRLASQGVSPSGTQVQFLTLLQQARVNAASSQLPYRGRKGKSSWLNELENCLSNIWVMGPGQPPFEPVVVERKRDFEMAVIQAMEMARMERNTRPGGARGRGRGGHRGGPSQDYGMQ